MLVERLFGEHATIAYDRPLQVLFGANAVVVLGVALVSPIIDSLTGAFGVPAARIGLIVTAVALPATVLIPVGGALADVYGRKPLLIGGLVLFTGGGACIAVGLSTFAFAPGLPIAGVGVATLAIGVGVVAPMYRSLITGFGPERLRGGIVSIGKSLGWIAVSLTPVVLGVAIETLSRSLAPAAAVQWTVAVTGATSGLLGAVCVTVAAGAPHVRGRDRE